jgi:hypothetical protein
MCSMLFAQNKIQRTVGNRNGWMCNRLLSFMGVVDADVDNEKENVNNDATAAADERRGTPSHAPCVM